MLRVIDITRVVIKYRLDEYLARFSQAKFLNMSGKITRKLFNVKQVDGTFPVRVKLALEELGPVFVKFGQILSTRQDALPESLIKELKKLRDDVQPFDTDTAIKIIEQELGADILDIFESFPNKPHASASVAQVYFATLKTGEEVAVKILRPNIKQTIINDLELFSTLAGLISAYRSKLKIINLKGILAEIKLSMIGELDLTLEAQNAIKFAENFKDIPYVHVPKIYSEFTTRNVLVMERMYGFPVDDILEIEKRKLNLTEVVTRGIELNLLQIFKYGFFHADQHTGNVWLSDDGGRVYLDFGIMGTLKKDDKVLLAKTMVFLFTKNFKELVEIQLAAGWFNASLDKQVLEKTYKSIGNAMIDKSQKDYSIVSMFSQILAEGEKNGLVVPIEFTLLIKNLLIIEGVSKKLDPSINLRKVGENLIMKHFKSWFVK